MKRLLKLIKRDLLLISLFACFTFLTTIFYLQKQHWFPVENYSLQLSTDEIQDFKKTMTDRSLNPYDLQVDKQQGIISSIREAELEAYYQNLIKLNGKDHLYNKDLLQQRKSEQLSKLAAETDALIKEEERLKSANRLLEYKTEIIEYQKLAKTLKLKHPKMQKLLAGLKQKLGLSHQDLLRTRFMLTQEALDARLTALKNKLYQNRTSVEQIKHIALREKSEVIKFYNFTRYYFAFGLALLNFLILSLCSVLNNFYARKVNRIDLQEVFETEIYEFPKLNLERSKQSSVQNLISYQPDSQTPVVFKPGSSPQELREQSVIKKLAGDLLLDQKKQQNNIFLISGMKRTNGLSTVFCNLAVGFAHYTQSTLVIDLNFDYPEVHSNFNIPEGAKGFSDYLSGDYSLKQTCYRYSRSGIFVFPMGTKLLQAQKLLSSGKLQNKIKQLSRRFENIIINIGTVENNAAFSLTLEDLRGLYIVLDGEKDNMRVTKSVLGGLNSEAIKKANFIINRS